MYTVKLGDYFIWGDQVVKCNAINPGQKAISFVIKEPMICPDCGHRFEIEKAIEIIEGSPLFQENVKPVPTITPTI